MNNGLVFLVGVVGSLAPDIARWHRRGGRSIFSKRKIVSLVLFALVGGVVAVILPAVNYYAAFYVGATWDLSMSAALHRGGPFTKPKPVELQCKRMDVPKKGLIQIFWDSLRDHADDLF